MKTFEEFMNLELPKWPQCIITGTKISEKDALEIIRRTDRFFFTPAFAGNNKEWDNYIIDSLKIPCVNNLLSNEEFNDMMSKCSDWSKNWKFIYLPYLGNDYVSCACIEGAQGWCHPDGEIGYGYNIGKWPEVNEVYDEFKLIAETFPFLELECTLMRDEYCEQSESNHPIISFLVRDGEVECVDPGDRNIHREFDREIPDYSEIDESLFEKLITQGNDSKISKEIIDSWKKYVN